MDNFYKIHDKTLASRGSPWGWRVISEHDVRLKCPTCQVVRNILSGDIQIFFDPNKGTRWPDILGCATYTGLIVSEHVLDAFFNEGLGKYETHNVVLCDPLPKRLAGVAPPKYFTIDGEKILGAKLDFEKSGFVNGKFCPDCGYFNHDFMATIVQFRSTVWPIVLIPGSWNNSDLFTLDYSSHAFYCTERVKSIITKYKLKNFMFTPSERATWA